MSEAHQRAIAEREKRALKRAFEAFVAERGIDGPRGSGERARQIRFLPQTTWQGVRPMVQLVCRECREPRWEPHAVAWHLIDLASYVCNGCINGRSRHVAEETRRVESGQLGLFGAVGVCR